jgi:hypothetical protein
LDLAQRQLVLLDPTGLVIDKQYDIYSELSELFCLNEYTHDDAPGCFYMMYGILQAWKQFTQYSSKAGIRYDAVIRLRFDILLDDVSAIVSDVMRVADSMCAIMPRHNWLDSVNVMFDGLIIAPPLVYDRFIQHVLSNFSGRYYSMKDSGAIFPEAIITYSLLHSASSLQYCSSTVFIVRPGPRIEQVFTPHKSFKDLSVELKRLAFLFHRLGPKHFLFVSCSTKSSNPLRIISSFSIVAFLLTIALLPLMLFRRVVAFIGSALASIKSFIA